MRNRILFLTLKIFSTTGGIEKVNRVLGKALYEHGLQYGGLLTIFSMYGPKGKADGNKYFPQLLFTGFGNHRVRFILKSMRQGCKSRIVILSHINLLIVGWLIKMISPRTRLVLLAHGIEVWDPLPFWKRRMLNACELILPVSRFTKEKMKSLHGLPEEKFRVLNNCLDPFLELPLQTEKDSALLERYGLQKDQFILLTVSRMMNTEQYKGYDKVLQALPLLVQEFPGICYMLAGKYDYMEKERLDAIIDQLGLKKNVIFTGFVEDDELARHFKLADIFVMPSEKEGFGIVFIEAMFYGLPVIAGNKDGSVDALVNGELGILVDPDDITELHSALHNLINNRKAYLPDHDDLLSHFGYTAYKEQLAETLGL